MSCHWPWGTVLQRPSMDSVRGPAAGRGEAGATCGTVRRADWCGWGWSVNVARARSGRGLRGLLGGC
jgi:hypothetical protein